MSENSKKLSLRGYYLSLPDRVAPKLKLLEDIQKRCEELGGKAVTITSVRNWVLYGIKPKNESHVKAISEVTQIKEEDLWLD